MENGQILERDLCDLKRQLDTLRRSQQQWSLEFITEDCERITGYTAEELLTKKTTFARLIHPEDQDRLWEEVQEAVRRNRPFELTYRIRTKTGEEKWIWERGRAACVHIRLLLQQEMVKLSIEDDGIGMDAGAARTHAEHSGAGMGLAHMKERAHVINGKLLIESKHPSPAGSMSPADRFPAKRSCSPDRSGAITRMEDGSLKMQLRRFDMRDLVRRAVHHLGGLAEERDLKFKLPPNPIEASCDDKYIVRTLKNLVGNAIKFTSKKDPICVCVMMRGERVRVEVRDKGPGIPEDEERERLLTFEIEDTGCGIAPHEIGKVFEYFEQTSSGLRSGNGTGLGMAISREFARMMDGDITVKSRVNRGTCFHIRFYAHDRFQDRRRPGAPGQRLRLRRHSKSPERRCMREIDSSAACPRHTWRTHTIMKARNSTAIRHFDSMRSRSGQKFQLSRLI